MPARSIWNGTLAVGDVSFPVRLYALVEEHRVRFREVHLTDGGRIAHRRVGAESGEEVPAERIRHAYELEDGTQVTFDEDELSAARGTRAKVIEVEHFVPRSQVDPIFYERPYALGAQDGGEHAYRVMQAALARTGRLGIARLTLRTREQLVAIAAHGDTLRLHTLRFADEVVSGHDLEVVSRGREATARELEMAKRLVETMAAPWEPERHTDRHREAVLELIRRKAAGESPVGAAAPEPEPTPDLMAALQASLAGRATRARRARVQARSTPTGPATGTRRR